MNEYEISDLNGGLFSNNGSTIIKAKSPLSAARKYIESLGENKTVKRDLLNHGRLVVYGRNTSYVYEVN